MHEKIFRIFQERIKLLSAHHFQDMYADSIELAAEYACTEEPVPFHDRLSLEYKPIHEGVVWGKAWDNAWFHLTGIVPEQFAGKELCLRLNAESELLIYGSDGVPLYGLTDRSVFDTRYSKERFPLNGLNAGDKIDIWFEATANRMLGIDLPEPEEKAPANPLGSYSPRVNSLRLCVFDREVWLFMLEMETLSGLLEVHGIADYRGKQLLDKLSYAVDIYNYEPENAAKARTFLQDEVFSLKAEDGALTAFTIGHAHIDVGWLWKVRESTRKAARTFSSQLMLMKEYPEFKFGASQAHLYRQMKLHYPELFEQIKERVKEGRWEVQGGMYVEADCNVISGESMVRQFLHGKNFFRDEFGVDVKNLWLPDVFGYSAAMPQIIKKAGCDYFLTQKISWNQINQFPYHTFRWFGVDGTNVLTHFPPENTYNSFAGAALRVNAANRFNEAGFLPGFMSLVGIGDGGGGPSENHLERNRIVQNLRGCPKAEWSFASAYFDRISKYQAQLPEWHGELYLELHRGTLTTQSRTKRGNRRCEQMLTAWEILASALPAGDWPHETLDSAWKTVLVNQFHDIIPGSSIREVYEEAEQEHAQVLQTAQNGITSAAEKLFRKNPDCAVLVNTLSRKWSGLTEIPENWNGSGVVTEDGTELPVQNHDGKTFVSVELSGNSFLTIKRNGTADASEKDTGTLILENDLIRYEFDRNGHLIHAYDKELNREFLASPGNVLSLYHDLPLFWDAWDVDMYYRREKIMEPVCTNVKTVRKGNAFSVAEFEFKTDCSVISQQVVLTNGSKRLDFITRCDWNEHRKLLRVAFPLTVQSEKASFDIQYAFVERPAHDNTSWEQAKFETCGQRYADISNKNFGAALLNDCKYGYYVRNSTLDLALLRSPKYPDRFADQGEQIFTYSFLPHKHSLAESEVMREAANLNRPLLFADNYESGSAEMPFRLESDHITMEVVKRGEKDDSLIVRLIETSGGYSNGKLHFRQTPSAVYETDLMEWNLFRKLETAGKELELSLKPFEILTLKVIG